MTFNITSTVKETICIQAEVTSLKKLTRVVWRQFFTNLNVVLVFLWLFWCYSTFRCSNESDSLLRVNTYRILVLTNIRRHKAMFILLFYRGSLPVKDFRWFASIRIAQIVKVFERDALWDFGRSDEKNKMEVLFKQT